MVAAKRSKRGGAERAKVMVVDARGEELGSMCVHLRDAGLKIIPISRLDAAIPLYRVLKPDAAILAANAPDYPEIALGKQLRLVSGGTLPLFYLVDKADSHSRTYVLRRGFALDVFERPVQVEEVAAKLTANVRLKAAIERASQEPSDPRALALKDPRTGLSTRALLLELLAGETRRCERYGGSFSLIRARLEGVARLRREEGADAADRLLVLSSVALGQSVRDADELARTGPAEFSILLPNTPGEALPVIAGRMAQRFELARLQISGRVVKGALLLGMASFPEALGTPAQIFAAAGQDYRPAREFLRWVGPLGLGSGGAGA